MSDQLDEEKNTVKIKQTKVSELEECLRKKDSENEHLKSKVVDFTKVHNLQVQVTKLKSENEDLKLLVEKLTKACEIVEPKPDYEWCKALEDSELKEDALGNKAIMEGLINDDNDDESRYERKKRWNVYDDTNHDHTHVIDHEADEREKLCEIHELPVCTIRRFKMIKYSFEQDEDYVVVKEDEYDDLARANENACRAYQEIFRMMDEGWMVTKAE
ncbi:hypothetical protein Tco_0445836 [Tanacetum coccineum]